MRRNIDNMTSIERNFNGVLHQVTVKQEERRMRMVEGEEELAILQEPRVTEISLEETEPGGDQHCRQPAKAAGGLDRPQSQFDSYLRNWD